MQMENLKLKVGFNVIVVYYERYKRPNKLLSKSFEDLWEMFEMLFDCNYTVVSVYYAVCDSLGNILRGITVPPKAKHKDYYTYKERLHLEYVNEQKL